VLFNFRNACPYTKFVHATFGCPALGFSGDDQACGFLDARELFEVMQNPQMYIQYSEFLLS
jgi:hypothetical protein